MMKVATVIVFLAIIEASVAQNNASTIFVTVEDLTTDVTTIQGTTMPTPGSTKATTTGTTPTLNPGPHEWEVKGGDGKICMKMSFIGKIKARDVKEPAVIPGSADPSMSKCMDQTSDFSLGFTNGNTAYVLIMSFLMQEKKTSYLWNTTITSVGHEEVIKESTVMVRFETPSGKYFDCEEQTIPVGENFNLTLSSMKIQPFATFADNDYGGSFSCEPAKSPNAALIVGLVLGGIIVVLLIAIGVLCRQKSKNGYNNFS